MVRLRGESGIGVLESCPSPTCPIAGERWREQSERALGVATIPPLYAEACMQDVRQPADFLARVEAAMHDGESILLSGRSGTGKTYLAVALLRAALEAGRDGRFVVVPDLLDRIRRAYGDAGPGADEVVEAVERVDFLVLDDLGTEQATPWALEKLYQIVNARILNLRQMVITTNLDGPTLTRQLGQRIASRLAGACVRLQTSGPDRRLGARP